MRFSGSYDKAGTSLDGHPTAARLAACPVNDGDDDPSNISPRVYLPIIATVILLAIVALAVVVFVL